MRMLLSFSLILLLATACKKESAAPEVLLMERTDTTSTLKIAGQFMSGPYGTVTGSAKIYNTGTGAEVLLDSLMASNGPDLYVYLSKEIMPVNFVSLGKLKSTLGSQVYAVPSTTNVAEYRYVCVHCQQYNHLFGYAALQ